MNKWSSKLLLFFAWSGILAACTLATYTLVTVVPSSEREREYQRQRIEFLEEQVANTERSIRIKREFLNKLNTNQAFLERVARQKLKYVRPNELVIHVEDDR